MDPVTSHFLTFLIGTATGGAGAYFAEKYTDKRRKKEAISEEDKVFGELLARMPDLLGEMKEDLEVAEHSEWRDFFVISKGLSLWPSENSFFYEDDGSNSYLSKTRILEEYGLVTDITPGNAPMFRMREKLVRSLITPKE